MLEALRFSIADRYMSPDKHIIAKSIFDKGIALFGIIFFAPLLLLSIALIKLDSRGPVIIIVKRPGLNNKVIRICKFRTTYILGGDQSTPQRMSQNDPRVTRVGRFLRVSSLDMLPQLISVVLGELSLVELARNELPHLTSVVRGERRHRSKADRRGQAGH